MTFEDIVPYIEVPADWFVNFLAGSIEIMDHPTLVFLFGTHPEVVFLFTLLMYPVCRLFRISHRVSLIVACITLLVAMVTIIPAVGFITRS